MIDLSKFAIEVHELAKAKGWWDSPRSLETCLALVHSEISEALECIRNGELEVMYANSAGATHSIDMGEHSYHKPVGLPIELADVVIRVLDTCVAFDLEVLDPVIEVGPHVRPDADVAGKAIFEMHRAASDRGLSELVSMCRIFATVHGIDLDQAIVQKHAFNATRPHRHGGKSL